MSNDDYTPSDLTATFYAKLAEAEAAVQLNNPIPFSPADVRLAQATINQIEREKRGELSDNDPVFRALRPTWMQY